MYFLASRKVRLVVTACVAMASIAVSAKVKVACIGDSITYGYGLENRENGCYPAQLQELLEKEFHLKYEVRNFGNATANIAPDELLDGKYMEETLRAIVQELRGKRKIPFLMMGLPKMNRPWEPYRTVQKKVCEETGAIYLDSFGAGLGEANDVHPRNKIPFAELVANAAAKALRK